MASWSTLQATATRAIRRLFAPPLSETLSALAKTKRLRVELRVKNPEWLRYDGYPPANNETIRFGSQEPAQARLALIDANQYGFAKALPSAQGKLPAHQMDALVMAHAPKAVALE